MVGPESTASRMPSIARRMVRRGLYSLLTLLTKHMLMQVPHE